MKNVKAILLAAVSSAVIIPATASAIMGQNGNCQMNETAQVSISFNGYDKDVSAVKAKLDAKIQEIKTLGQDQHFSKFDVQSNNYSINANYNNGYGSEMQYQYNGSASFAIQPAEKALDFMVLLSKKGYQANVNVSSYNNGNCTQNLLK